MAGYFTLLFLVVVAAYIMDNQAFPQVKVKQSPSHSSLEFDQSKSNMSKTRIAGVKHYK